jgi:hypothetical protein
MGKINKNEKYIASIDFGLHLRKPNTIGEDNVIFIFKLEKKLYIF